MEILFTTSDKILSRLIRDITGEPVSHCAIKYRGYVLHSTVGGVQLIRYDDFIKSNKTIFSVQIPLRRRLFLQAYSRFKNAGYDYGALMYLGLRYLSVKSGIKIPKANLWQDSGLLLCTEFITSAILKEQDSLITPYQLYLKLNNFLGVRK